MPRRMRVLHVYKSYYPDTVGGIEQVISQLGRGLAALGHENRIFTLSPNPVPAVLRYPEGEVHRSRQTLEVASNNVSLSAFRDFRRQLEWADVVHYQFPWPFGDLLHVAVGSRKPSVVSYQSDIVRQKWLLKAYRPLRDRFLLSVGAVVTTSPQYHASSEVLRNLPVPVKVVPNGVEESSFPQPRAEVVDRWRARLGEGFFLFVGVLRYYKGLHTLVQAARGFAGQVVIAGDGPERSALERQVGSGTGGGNVHLLGRVSDEDKMALLQLCRAFVFPSHLRSEAYGMSLVEAAMAGKPMVSCEIGTGTTFINENGTTGLAIPPADPDALRVAMQTLMDDADLARKLGAQARERFLAHFSASRMASAYEEIYAGLLAR
jgi:glycosyltransferase involved in cell wall biosynthesis